MIITIKERLEEDYHDDDVWVMTPFSGCLFSFLERGFDSILSEPWFWGKEEATYFSALKDLPHGISRFFSYGHSWVKTKSRKCLGLWIRHVLLIQTNETTSLKLGNHFLFLFMIWSLHDVSSFYSSFRENTDIFDVANLDCVCNQMSRKREYWHAEMTPLAEKRSRFSNCLCIQLPVCLSLEWKSRQRRSLSHKEKTCQRKKGKKASVSLFGWHFWSLSSKRYASLNLLCLCLSFCWCVNHLSCFTWTTSLGNPDTFILLSLILTLTIVISFYFLCNFLFNHILSLLCSNLLLPLRSTSVTQHLHWQQKYRYR